MKNKKIVVCLLIAIMVLGFTLTALVGCKDWKEVSYEEMVDFLNAAVENTVADKNINDLKLGALLTVDTSYGDSKKKYTIDIAADVSLKENSDKNSASLIIRDETVNKNVISLYYDEATASANAPAAVYMQMGDGDTAKKFILNGVNIKDVLSKNNAYMSDTNAGEIGDAVSGGIASLFDTLGAATEFDIFKTQVYKKGTAYRLEINLGDVLQGETISNLLNDLGGAVDNIIEATGLEIDLQNLSAILPNIVLGINVNVSSKKAEKATITGISADLFCPAKDIVINKTDKRGALLDLKIANDFSAKASIDLKFGDDVNVIKLQNYDGYQTFIGAINLSAKGTFELKTDIKDISLFNLLNINMPKDTYNLEFAIHADPSKLVDLDFTGIHCLPHAIDTAIDAVNAALNYLNVKITTKDGKDFLQIELEKNAGGNLVIGNVNLSALGLDPTSGLGSLVSRLKGMGLKAAWTAISGLNLFQIPLNVDPGYKLVSSTNGKYVYAVDTEHGYVDEDNDGNPDKQEDGRFATTEEYDNWTGIPVLKSTLTAGYVEKDGKWVVDTEHGYQDNNDDGMVDREANGEFSCNRNYKNYNGKLITKAEWDALSEEEKNPPKEEAPAIPTEVRDLLDNLAIVAKDGQLKISLSGMGFKLDKELEKNNVFLSATLTLDKTGITVDANVKGLENVKTEVDGMVQNPENPDDPTDLIPGKEWESIGLPEDIGVGIQIKFSDIKYGTVGK